MCLYIWTWAAPWAIFQVFCLNDVFFRPLFKYWKWRLYNTLWLEDMMDIPMQCYVIKFVLGWFINQLENWCESIKTWTNTTEKSMLGFGFQFFSFGGCCGDVEHFSCVNCSETLLLWNSCGEPPSSARPPSPVCGGTVSWGCDYPRGRRKSFHEMAPMGTNINTHEYSWAHWKQFQLSTQNQIMHFQFCLETPLCRNIQTNTFIQH